MLIVVVVVVVNDTPNITKMPDTVLLNFILNYLQK